VITAIGQIIASRRVLGLLLAVAICGCNGPSYKWAGEWQGNMNLKPSPGFDEVKAHTAGMVELTIRDNGTFYLFSLLEMEGTLRYEGDKAYLTIETIMKQPVRAHGEAAEKMNKEIVLTPLDENTILYEDPGEVRRLPDGSKPPPLKLSRKAKSP
jgi:hypothetical protein